MAPDSAGTNVFLGNMAGSMSPRGVRSVLGPREEETSPGAIDFCGDGAREKTRNGRGDGERNSEGAFWRPGRSHEINFYDFGLKLGRLKLLHVIDGGARPRTDSTPKKYSSAASRGSSLHAEVRFCKIGGCSDRV